MGFHDSIKRGWHAGRTLYVLFELSVVPSSFGNLCRKFDSYNPGQKKKRKEKKHVSMIENIRLITNFVFGLYFLHG